MAFTFLWEPGPSSGREMRTLPSLGPPGFPMEKWGCCEARKGCEGSAVEGGVEEVVRRSEG